MARPIVFLSDYGLDDEFVGICHGVIARVSPESRVIDLTHGVPAQDVLRGAILLAQSMLYMPEDAVFLGVVDPGVGTARRPVAVRDEAGFLTVGPDNGLLSLSWVGGPAEAVEIASPDAVLLPISPTFHGRDVFAPAAAHLARGARLEDLGPAIDPRTLFLLEVPALDVGETWVRGRVAAVDRFGNLQLSIHQSDLVDLGMQELSSLLVSAGARDMELRRVVTFGELQPGEDGIVVDSSGALALVRNGESAAEALQLAPGDDVLLRREAG